MGTRPAPGAGGYLVHRWNGTDWEPGDRGGVRVAVSPSGEPAVVTVLGGLSVRSGGIWTDLPGLFTDVAFGPDGSLWALRARCPGPARTSCCAGPAPGGRSSLSSRCGWRSGPTGNRRSSNPAGLVYQRTAGNWLPVPGLYRDVELGSDGTLYAVGIDDTLDAFSALGQYVVAGNILEVGAWPMGTWLVTRSGQIVRQ